MTSQEAKASRFKIGDSVFHIKDGAIVNEKITVIYITDKDEIYYAFKKILLDYPSSSDLWGAIKESRVFGNKEDLIKSLQNSNE